MIISKDVGRNDPCPCGSGKKYKYCCLPKEEENRGGRVVRDRENVEKVNDEPNNPDDTWQEQLRKFEKMGLEDKFDFFYDRYEDPEVVDGDFALEMLNELTPSIFSRGQVGGISLPGRKDKAEPRRFSRKLSILAFPRQDAITYLVG